MLRRLHHTQPESFAFTPANLAWAEAQITKYPEGRQASAVIPLLWRAQEQEGWLSQPAIEHVAHRLGMANIRVLEVASFYFMFQLQPVGSVANIQICGTTSCLICGAEDLIGVCRDKIAEKPHQLSEDGKFTWEEVECLGACSNAPMAQIGKDYYEDLTAQRFAEILDELAAGNVPVPGPQNGRYASEPKAGLTSLEGYEESGHTKYNASVQRATDIGDTVKRIDGTEVPLLTPWRDKTAKAAKAAKPAAKPAPAAKATPAENKDVDKSATATGSKPATLETARDGGADDLKMIKGVGPKLEKLLHSMGFFHFDQVASWTAEEISWVDENLEGFKGRVSRDDWVAQAKLLASGQETDFSKRAKY
ncbi:MAG: NADH-quinone oxidoreductase subunit NuoE [Rhodobacteraceae bacterium]|nr:NADH-quinone oxidoreductase subunit NuoE [Paracoccaceae bacterium]